MADLVAIETPRDAQFLRPRALVWERVDDYPGYEDLVDLVDADALERLLAGREAEDAVGETVSGTKVGGWPSLIQAEVTWPGDAYAAFAFQVDSDGVGRAEPLGWGRPPRRTHAGGRVGRRSAISLRRGRGNSDPPV